MSSSTPLVIIIDLDGTIIGDISPQIMTFELFKSLKSSGYKFSYDMSDLRTKLKSGLVRPYFDSFIKTLSSSLPVEFFVYTASEKNWAEIVIKNIESSYDFKFNRPIFARQYCLYSEKDREYKKSISLIRPNIIKFLKKKYGVSFTKQDLEKNTLIVDNNNVYHQNDQKHLLLCPTYNYRVPENLVSMIKPDTYRKYHQLINSSLKKYIPLSSSSDYNIFQKEFYMYYISFLDNQLRNNGRYIQDKFWLQLRDIIVTQNIRRFDETSVKFISNTIRNRLGIMAKQVSNSSIKTISSNKHQRQQTFF
jgi:hypothetical protein